MTTRRVGRGALQWVAVFVVSLAPLLAANSARAAAAEAISFDFRSNSSFSLLGGTIVTPPDGTIHQGSGEIFVEATAPGVYVPGGLFQLNALAIGGTVLKNFAGQADISGSFSVVQTAPLTGTLAPGLTGGDFAPGTNLALFSDTQIGCTGPGCGSLGLPISDVGPSLLSVSFLPVSGLDQPGNAQINLSFAFEIDGVLGTFDLVGVEVARSYIPEPGSFVLVATGFGLLAARRRRSRPIA